MKATALWQHIWNDQAPARGSNSYAWTEDRRTPRCWPSMKGRALSPGISDGFRRALATQALPHPRRRRVRRARAAPAPQSRNEWRDGPGNRLRTLDGCQDLDLWPTPFTNSPAAWRLGLAHDQREEIAVVFIEAPTLEVRVMHQAYTRLDARHLLYQNLDGSGFHAVLRLSADGLVEDYPGLFQRLHRAPPC